jgi:hypothetical protein
VQWFNTRSVAKPDFIIWNDRKEEFVVQVKMCCFKDNYQFLADIKRIPVEIALREKCSCGGELSLSHFSFKTDNDDIVFDGTFFCKRCHDETHSVFQTMKSDLIAIWRDTKEVKIVSGGIKYEKK